MAVTELAFGGLHEAKTRVRSTETGVANTLLTAKTARGVAFKLLWVMLHYSGAVIQAGVAVKIDSGLGANFDVPLNTGTADTQDTLYIPAKDMVLAPGDEIQVDAPAGGATDIAYCTIMTEDL